MRRANGFTLIELMIAIALIGILAAIAFPSYQGSVRKGNRGVAQSFMMDVAQRQQQIFLDSRTYAPKANNAAFSSAPLNYPVPSDVSKNYQVSVTVNPGPPPSFTITATPIAGSKQFDDGKLNLLSNGARGRRLGAQCFDWSSNTLSTALDECQ